MSRGDHKVSKISSEAIFAVRPISASKFLISLIFCLSLILVDLRFQTSNIIRGYVQDFLSPLYTMIKLPAIFINRAIEVRVSKQELRESLYKYKEDNQKLELINSQLKELTKRIQELNVVVNFAQIEKESYLMGQKRSLSVNPLRPSLVLDINDPLSLLKINQPILSREGIIGKITSVGISSVEVMMTQDPQSLIPILSSSTRIHGILKGKGLERRGVLVNVKKTASFKEGEELYSSGLGDVFPPNYLVGKIVLIEDKADNEFLQIEVEFIDLPKDQDYFIVFTN